MATTKITSDNITDGAVTSAKLDTNIAIAGTLGVTGDANFDSNTLFVDASANAVGIGTSSPQAKIHLQDTNDVHIQLTDSGNVAARVGANGTAMVFGVDGSNGTTERMRITNAGKVGIGTASPFSPLHISKTNWSSGAPYGTVAYIEGGAVNDLNWGHLLISQTGTTTDTGGRISFGANGQNPIAGIRAKYKGATYGDLAFLTRPSGGTNTERMVITGAGEIQMGGLLQGDTALNVTETRANQWTSAFYNNSSSPYGLLISSTGAAPNNATNKLIQMSDTSTIRAIFYSNGGLHNYQSNDSNLSDSREKKNIVNADAAWDDVKAWEIKKFHYNEDSDSDPKRLGVIAQDLETNNLELIANFQKQAAADEVLWTNEDDLPKGVSVGDVKTAAQEEIMRKGVKEQQMYWMAIKALQEAMTEIETLKTRLETLENA